MTKFLDATERLLDFIKKFFLPVALFLSGIIFLIAMLVPKDNEEERVLELEKTLGEKIEQDKERIRLNREKIEIKKQEKLNKIKESIDRELTRRKTGGNSDVKVDETISSLNDNWDK